MKPMRSSESVRVRRELAHLLRRLRAIRKGKLSEHKLAEQVNAVLTEAQSLRRFGTIAKQAESGDRLGQADRMSTDNRTPSQEALAPPRIEPVHELEDMTAEYRRA